MQLAAPSVCQPRSVLTMLYSAQSSQQRIGLLGLFTSGLSHLLEMLGVALHSEEITNVAVVQPCLEALVRGLPLIFLGKGVLVCIMPREVLYRGETLHLPSVAHILMLVGIHLDELKVLVLSGRCLEDG